MLRQMIRPPTLSSPRVAVRKHHHEMVGKGTVETRMATRRERARTRRLAVDFALPAEEVDQLRQRLDVLGGTNSCFRRELSQSSNTYGDRRICGAAQRE